MDVPVAQIIGQKNRDRRKQRVTSKRGAYVLKIGSCQESASFRYKVDLLFLKEVTKDLYRIEHEKG